MTDENSGALDGSDWSMVVIKKDTGWAADLYPFLSELASLQLLWKKTLFHIFRGIERLAILENAEMQVGSRALSRVSR